MQHQGMNPIEIRGAGEFRSAIYWAEAQFFEILFYHLGGRGLSPRWDLVLFGP